jgi:hypothetical protein
MDYPCNIEAIKNKYEKTTDQYGFTKVLGKRKQRKNTVKLTPSIPVKDPNNFQILETIGDTENPSKETL